MRFEKWCSIRVPGTRFKVHGRFQGNTRQPLFIMVHGLTGNCDESFYRDGTKYLGERGYATFRLNLYGWKKGSRKLLHSTLRTHARDLNAVTAYFRRKGFKSIFVCGHSYGGATILLSDPAKIDGAVLWDPTHGATFTKRKWGTPPARYIKQLKGFVVDWGVAYVFGQKMVREADMLQWDDLALKFSAPTRIVCAGAGVLRRGCKRYFDTLPGIKDLKILPGATHYFNDKPKMEEQVYEATYRWLERLRRHKR